MARAASSILVLLRFATKGAGEALLPPRVSGSLNRLGTFR